MKLIGMQVGLDPGHIVLDGDPAPLLQRVTGHPIFGPYIVAKWLNGLRCKLVWRYASAQATVLDGDPAPSPKREHPHNLWPMSIVAKRLNRSRCHMVRRHASTQLPSKRATAPSFRLRSIVDKRLDR